MDLVDHHMDLDPSHLRDTLDHTDMDRDLTAAMQCQEVLLVVQCMDPLTCLVPAATLHTAALEDHLGTWDLTLEHHHHTSDHSLTMDLLI